MTEDMHWMGFGDTYLRLFDIEGWQPVSDDPTQTLVFLRSGNQAVVDATPEDFLDWFTQRLQDLDFLPND